MAALLTARTISEAASSAGIGERTLRRWLDSDADFQNACAAARKAAFNAAIGRIQGLTEVAADTLAGLLDAGAPPAVRLAAVRLVLETAIHERDAEVILERLAALERAQQDRN
ncbi:MAG: hypothetical protein AB7I13_03190 [Vicinamibacterales bacterium]